MVKKNKIEKDNVNFINTVWAYNRTKERFEFDCKTYCKDGKWYWLHNDKFVRNIGADEKEFMDDYLKNNS